MQSLNNPVPLKLHSIGSDTGPLYAQAVHMILIQITVNFRRMDFHMVFHTALNGTTEITRAFLEEVQELLDIGPQYGFHIDLLAFTLRLWGLTVVNPW